MKTRNKIQFERFFAAQLTCICKKHISSDQDHIFRAHLDMRKAVLFLL